ncbi:hypothetical protein E4U57_006013 [Claviceps arundinis]|uniref:Uncharacterized protein n=1 Tax=Claviceps arundinis TaxID=1623583 RepID=A0ABQ7PPH6_9HYPO|nr:hypothetical protein E4U57_006013 [Claviceps arundinis]
MNIKMSEYCCASWTSVVLSVPDPLESQILNSSDSMEHAHCYQVPAQCALVQRKRLLCDLGLLNAISSIQA